MNAERNLLAEIDELKNRVAKLEQQQQINLSQKFKNNHQYNEYDECLRSMKRSMQKQSEFNEWFENIYYNKKVQIGLGILLVCGALSFGLLLGDLVQALIIFLKK